MTDDQIQENIKRMKEILNDDNIINKISWRVKIMSGKSKNNSCILCNNIAVGLGFFLLHKSNNIKFGLKENDERFFLYHVCKNHLSQVEDQDRNILMDIETRLIDDNSKHSNYVDIES